MYTHIPGLKHPGEEGIGVGLDSCVLPTRHEGLFLVQTTDLYPFHTLTFAVLLTFNNTCFNFLNFLTSFYPLVEDPYMQVAIEIFIAF